MKSDTDLLMALIFIHNKAAAKDIKLHYVLPVILHPLNALNNRETKFCWCSNGRFVTTQTTRGISAYLFVITAHNA